MDIIEHIAQELAVQTHQVTAAVRLLDEGASVPFIARYRKEVTQGLDDTQLRTLEQRLTYLRELSQRRDSVLDSIRSQGKLTPELSEAIHKAHTKTTLEDLYLPYKPKRRSKAQTAREAGLAPLADRLLGNPTLDPTKEAASYILADKGIHDGEAALEGARHILMERLSEDATLLNGLRETVWRNGILSSSVIPGQEQAGSKFQDYFDYREAIAKIPPHRALALFRGRNEAILRLSLQVANDEAEAQRVHQHTIARRFDIPFNNQHADSWLNETVRQVWKIKLLPRIDLDLKLRLREAAEQEAMQVFTHNMRDLLLAAPAGPRVTMGIDPGIRTGIKLAVVDPTGKLLTTATLYPHPPRRQWDAAGAALSQLIQQHSVDLITIGNGTGSRETDKLVTEVIKAIPEHPLHKLIVSEAGASVYSASEIAAAEFPELDVSLRGAVSIARRIQDPLAELVKIDPKSIGVGQYQHDVNQVQLGQRLSAVVEDCVNAVGVDVNTASVSLLKQVSGLSPSLARNIVAYRDQNGVFTDRSQLKQVPRLGAKAFEQAAGFLRIMRGTNPLDTSAVHPEAYPVIERIQRHTGQPIPALMGQSSLLKQLDPAEYTDAQFGLPTVIDILSELEKPGRDPRPEFKNPTYQEGIDSITDLEPGMRLEGSVTNITNFGAFVDLGVHQDGLVHISHIADHFVKDPHSVVKTGQLVKVTILAVDPARQRISLSMKSKPIQEDRTDTPHTQPRRATKRTASQNQPKKPSTKPENAMAAAFARARKS